MPLWNRHFNNFLYKINSLYCILNSLSQLGYHITYLYFITLKQSKLASLQYHRTSFISSNSWSRLGSLWTRSSLKLMLNALQERVPALLHLAVGVFIQSLLLLFFFLTRVRMFVILSWFLIILPNWFVLAVGILLYRGQTFPSGISKLCKSTGRII